ncbi:MAG: hypothetical protein B7733_07460 [Myxococcales bacterium FL481]|nr:MAG: hypothetical protein B7733_07460 [Myxococcales bacterium FL481]
MSELGHPVAVAIDEIRRLASGARIALGEPARAYLLGLSRLCGRGAAGSPDSGGQLETSGYE